MTRHRFYDSLTYKVKQAAYTRGAWQRGVYGHLRLDAETRKCKRPSCSRTFSVPRHSPKLFCSQTCSAHFNNKHRARLTQETKKKIAAALAGLPNVNKGKVLVPRVEQRCLRCGNLFRSQRWEKKHYCSAPCAIRDIGSRATSPRAARAKAGIRSDIEIKNFLSDYSRRRDEEFRRCFPKIKLRLVLKPDYLKLQEEYAPLIKGWEFSRM